MNFNHLNLPDRLLKLMTPWKHLTFMLKWMLTLRSVNLMLFFTTKVLFKKTRSQIQLLWFQKEIHLHLNLALYLNLWVDWKVIFFFFYWHKWNLLLVFPTPFLDVISTIIILDITHIICAQLLLFTCSRCMDRDKKATKQINILHPESCSLLEH